MDKSPEDKKLFFTAKVLILFICIIALGIKVHKWWIKPEVKTYPEITSFDELEAKSDSLRKSNCTLSGIITLPNYVDLKESK